MNESGQDVAGRRANGDAAGDTIAAARHDVHATRQRMASTVVEIEDRISGTVASAKRKVDVATLARENPWPALGLAFAAGIALSATGADRKAATATVSAAKRAPDGAKQGASLAARATSAGLSYLASTAIQRLTRSRREGDSSHTSGYESKSLMTRLADTIKSPARELGAELRSGVEELPRANAPDGETGTATP